MQRIGNKIIKITWPYKLSTIFANIKPYIITADKTEFPSTALTIN